VKDIQIEQIATSQNIPDLNESATRRTNKGNPHLKASADHAKECHKELAMEVCQGLTISVGGIPTQEKESRVLQNDHRSGYENNKSENVSELILKVQNRQIPETVKAKTHDSPLQLELGTLPKETQITQKIHSDRSR
jgi:hypothetical protein